MKHLVVKLSKVMADIGTVAKRGYNTFHKYDYVTEADILEATRASLTKHGVFILSSVKSSALTPLEKGGNLTTVHVEYTFVDVDTGESYTVGAEGQGADAQDKGIYKAITGASKYFLMKNFLIPTGDDPENDAATAGTKAPAKSTAALPSDVKKASEADPPVSAAPTSPAKSGGFRRPGGQAKSSEKKAIAEAEVTDTTSTKTDTKPSASNFTPWR